MRLSCPLLCEEVVHIQWQWQQVFCGGQKSPNILNVKIFKYFIIF